MNAAHIIATVIQLYETINLISNNIFRFNTNKSITVIYGQKISLQGTSNRYHKFIEVVTKVCTLYIPYTAFFYTQWVICVCFPQKYASRHLE